MISILPVCTCSQVGQANSSTLASPLILFCCSSSLFIFSLSFYTHFLSLSLTQRLHLLEIFSMLFTTNLCFYSRRYTSRCLLASTCPSYYIITPYLYTHSIFLSFHLDQLCSTYTHTHNWSIKICLKISSYNSAHRCCCCRCCCVHQTQWPPTLT